MVDSDQTQEDLDHSSSDSNLQINSNSKTPLEEEPKAWPSSLERPNTQVQIAFKTYLVLSEIMFCLILSLIKSILLKITLTTY
jgi:hypothetical protein